MTCDEYRAGVTTGLAEGSGLPDGHAGSCPACARYGELARLAWETAGRDPDESAPPALAGQILKSCRRPRRADLTLLRPGPLAAAVLLVVGAIVLFRPAKAGTDGGSLFDADGMSVERYELPAGADAARAAEEIRREVLPEAWREGVCGLEAGEGWLRVRGTAEVQKAVREHLQRRR